MWVKICGVTRPEDAEAAARAGASAIGFVFWNRSPRAMSPHAAGRISEALPPGIERAGVFVDSCREEIVTVHDAASLTWAQLHGDEDAGFAGGLGVPWVKAIRLGADREVPGPRFLAALASGSHGGKVLLDAYVEGTPGGTGHAFDWSLAAEIAAPIRASGGRMILAGGLVPGNVGDAIRLARPDGVDVSGGVESAPGRKDAGRIREFVAEARAAFEEIARAAGGAS